MVTTGVGTEARPPVASGRPGWLSFYAVMSIVLGAMIALTIASELGGSTLMNHQAKLLHDMAGSTPNPGMQMQLDMQEKITAAMTKGRSLLLALAPVGLLAAGGLIAGGIGALSMRRWARVALLAAFALTFVHEAVRAKPVFERQLAVSEATQSSMSKLFDKMGQPSQSEAAPRPAPPQALTQAMGTMMNFATLAGMAFALALIILKIAFPIAGAVYLTRPRIRALFG